MNNIERKVLLYNVHAYIYKHTYIYTYTLLKIIL